MKGYVFAIRSHLSDKIYVGSTQSPLSVKMAGYRAQYKRYEDGERNDIAYFEILKYHDAYIEVLEVVQFDDKTELNARVNHFIRTLDCVNRQLADRTPVEYPAERIKMGADKKKKYLADKQAKQSKLVTCKCGIHCTRGSLSNHQITAKHFKAMKS